MCCSRKTLFILLGVASIVGLLIATGKVNAYATLPFLPFLLCPLMCIPMLRMGRKCKDGECSPAEKRAKSSRNVTSKDAA